MNNDPLLEYLITTDPFKRDIFFIEALLYRIEKIIIKNNYSYEDMKQDKTFIEYNDQFEYALVNLHKCYGDYADNGCKKLSNYANSIHASELKRLLIKYQGLSVLYFIDYCRFKGRLDLECKDYIKPFYEKPLSVLFKDLFNRVFK